MMHNGFGWNSPFSSTYSTYQSKTWLTSWAYFLTKEIWNTLWDFKVGGKENIYAASSTLSKVWNDPLYPSANLAHEPIFNEILFSVISR